VRRELTARVWREGDWFVAQCVEVDVASQGRTEAEAVRNLAEALQLHFTPPLPTLVGGRDAPTE
jgi:predicted RNase H-like HicB family nuclease